MRLRVSGEDSGNSYNLYSVMGKISADTELPNYGLLNSFIEALHEGHSKTVSTLRKKISYQMGNQALVDISAVIAAFNAFPRMADATGIPLEEVKKKISETIRADLKIDNFIAH